MSTQTPPPVDVPTVDDEYSYLEARRCACGGAWKLTLQSALPDLRDPGLVVDTLEVRCAACGRDERFRFRVRLRVGPRPLGPALDPLAEVDAAISGHQRTQHRWERLAGIFGVLCFIVLAFLLVLRACARS